jgi:hypothetical protein
VPIFSREYDCGSYALLQCVRNQYFAAAHFSSTRQQTAALQEESTAALPMYQLPAKVDTRAR